MIRFSANCPRCRQDNTIPAAPLKPRTVAHRCIGCGTLFALRPPPVARAHQKAGGAAVTETITAARVRWQEWADA